MATSTTLVKWRLLWPYRDNSESRLPVRMLFLAPEIIDWIDGTLFYLSRDRGRDLEPIEQVEAFFNSFVYDPEFTGVGDFVRITPHGEGVYEAKITDVRIFGWFFQPCQFIAVVGRMKKDLKGSKRAVSECQRAVVAFRNNLDLDEPKFVVVDHVRDLV